MRRFTKASTIFLCLAVISIGSIALQHNDAFAKKDAAFCVGEVNTFEVNVMGIKAGYQKMEVLSQTTYNGIDAYYIKAETKSIPDIERIYRYKLHDTMWAYIDAKTMLPLHIEKDIQEGDFKDKVTIDFDHKKRTGIYVSQKRAPKGKTFSWPKGDCLDVLSMVYYVRNKKISKNEKLSFYYLEEKEYLTEKVDITVSKGKYLKGCNCNELIFKQSGGRNIEVKMTDDDVHQPLSVKVGAFKVAGYNISIHGNAIDYTYGCN